MLPLASQRARSALAPHVKTLQRQARQLYDWLLQVPNAALRLRIAGAEPAAERSGDVVADKAVSTGRVYVLDAQGTPQALAVGTGISDGNRTELVLAPGTQAAKQLQVGAAVLVGTKTAGAAQGKPASRSPF
jgi:hypothetical protein